MPDIWLCESCDTNNLDGTESCRRCRRPRAAPMAEAGSARRSRAGDQQTRPPGGQQSRPEQDRTTTASPSEPDWTTTTPRPEPDWVSTTPRPDAPTDPGAPYPTSWNDYATVPPGSGAGSFGSGPAPGRRAGPVVSGLVAGAAALVVVLAMWLVNGDGGSGDGDTADTGETVTSTAVDSPSPTEPSPSAEPSPENVVPPSNDGPPSQEYQHTEGPLGLSLSLPAGWQPRNGPAEGNYQADDPTDPDVFLRFGGAPRPDLSVLDYLLGGERGNPNIQSGYQRLQLAQVSYLGSEAADWEFLFDRNGQLRHVYGRYWYDNGAMYMVYGSAPVEKWDRIAPLFSTALDSTSVG